MGRHGREQVFQQSSQDSSSGFQSGLKTTATDLDEAESHEPTPGTHSSSMIKTGAEEWAEKQKPTESSKLKGKVSNGENMSGCGPCQSSVS